MGRPEMRGATAAAVLALGVQAAPAQAPGGAGSMLPPPVDGPPIDLGLTQDAWREGKAREGQASPGQRVYSWKPGQTMTAYTRVGMTTALQLERAERMESVTVGDPNLLEVRVEANAENILYMRPLYAGADTSLHILTASGRLYTMVVATENEAAETTPDTVVMVRLPGPGRSGQRTGGPAPEAGRARTGARGGEPEAGGAEGWYSNVAETRKRDRTVLAAAAGQHAIVDPALLEEYGNLQVESFQVGRMRFDLEMLASSEEAIREIAPRRVMRDDVWTWLDYEGMPEARWPSVNVVTDGTESPVTVSTEANGRMLVVHAVGDLVLRSGPHTICIRRKRSTGTQWRADVTVDPRIDGVYGEGEAVGDTYATPGAGLGWDDRVRVELGAGSAGERRVREVLAAEGVVHEGAYPVLEGVAQPQAERLCRAVGKAGGECVVVRAVPDGR